MRKGLSSQPVDSHANRRHELELLFVPPDSADDFEVKYPYPDESPYLDTYDYPGVYPGPFPRPYSGAYPETYNEGENLPYPYPGEDDHDQNGGYPDPYPYPDPYDPYGHPLNPYLNPHHMHHLDHVPETKEVRFLYGTNDTPPPPVDRVVTPHHVSVWKQDKHPIRTAESSIGVMTSPFKGYTFEEEQKFLYEGLCEQLLKQRALEMTKQDENLGDTVPFAHIPTKGVCVHPPSKFSSSSESCQDSIDSVLSQRSHFASVQDSIQVAVNRGLEGRHGMVYSTSPVVTDPHSGPRDCVLSQIRHRVSSTATLFKRVVSRPFRHRADDEWQMEWRTMPSRGRRGVSRLFRRSSSSKWVPLNDYDRVRVVAGGDGGAMQCGEYGWWSRKLNSGAPTFL